MPTTAVAPLAPGVRTELTQRLQRAARWATWAAILAVVNAGLQFIFPGKQFFIGFGVTAAIGAPVPALLVTLLGAAALIALGELGSRRILWALLAAIALVAGDAVLTTRVYAAPDWFGFLWHVAVVIFLVQAIRVINDWEVLERLEAKSPSTVTEGPRAKELTTREANDMMRDLNLDMKSTRGKK